jgi:hypothetical protein
VEGGAAESLLGLWMPSTGIPQDSCAVRVRFLSRAGCFLTRGANPRESRSRIYRTIVCSSVVVSFYRPLRLLRMYVIPLYRLVNIE